MWKKIKQAFLGVNWTRVGVTIFVAGVVLASYSAWIYGKGFAAATAAFSSDTVKAIDKSGKDHAKIETEAYSLPSGPLDDEYSRWLLE
jgi:hypothetical protein